MVPAPEPPKRPQRAIPLYETLADVLMLDHEQTELLAQTADPNVRADAAKLLAAFRKGDGSWRDLFDEMA